jgi:esterase/lipase superfamily enzyme
MEVSMVMIYFIANRRPDDEKIPTDFTRDFSIQGMGALRYGFAEVTGRKLDKYDIHVEQEKLEQADEKSVVDESASVLGSKANMRRLREKMRKHSRDTIVYIHGYNVAFKAALTAAARLKRNFGKSDPSHPVNVVLFSWPSDGSMMPFLAYASDRQDAAASGAAVARAFMKLSDFLKGATPEEECEQHMHLVTHSMGNYVLRHALQEVRRHFAGRPPRVFGEIFMMAADEDDDAFEHDYKLAVLPRTAARVNLYFNRGDLALQTSDKTKGNPDRIGTDGPRLPNSVPAKVTQIDCTAVVGGLVEHSYYLDSERVVMDMKRVLLRTPSDEIDGRRFVPEQNRYRLIKG